MIENEKLILNTIVDRVISRYQNMMKKFKPCKPDVGEYLEQNLITNFAIEFSKEFPNADIYTEIPFKCKDEIKNKDLWKCRADMLIINKDKAYIIEAKGSQKGENFFNLIDTDIQRIKSQSLKESFMCMKNKDYIFPKEVYGIIIADYWGNKLSLEDEYINDWKTGKSSNDNINKLTNWKEINRLDAKKLENISDEYPYWFLAGIFELKDWNNIQICNKQDDSK